MSAVEKLYHPDGIFQKQELSSTNAAQIAVLDCIERNNGGSVDFNLQRMVALYPSWNLTTITQKEIAGMDWYLSTNDPNHISQTLTSNGLNRRVDHVAKKYIELQQNGLLEWDGQVKVESMIDTLADGNQLPPIVVVPGERYLDSPDSSFIDGVHRSLAVMVYHLRTQKNVELQAFVGQKANLLNRALTKFQRLFS
jgi:hypothetical protein